MKASSDNPSSLLLRLNSLQHGDVLLMLGRAKMSKAIALFSGGEFSHAALCTSPYTIFESDGETVIGSKVLKTVGYVHGGRETAQYGKVPGNPLRCAVYRHPMMSSISQKQFHEALEQVTTESFGKDYSKMSRLARLAETNGLLRWAVDLYCKFDDWRLSPDAIPDAFCSELVVRFYDRIGLPLFAEKKRPEDVSPNDLVRSQLRPVADVVFNPAELGPLSVPLHEPDSLSKAYETHDPFATYQHSSHLLSRTLTDLEQFAEQMRAQTQSVVAGFIKDIEQTVLTVSEHVHQCAEFGDHGCLRRAETLATAWTKLSDELPLIPSYAENDPDKLPPILRRLRLARRSLLRCVLLLRTRQLKLQSSRATGKWRRQIRRERQKLLKQGRANLILNVEFSKIMDSQR